jgi:hypothetical protein
LLAVDDGLVLVVSSRVVRASYALGLGRGVRLLLGSASRDLAIGAHRGVVLVAEGDLLAAATCFQCRDA